MNAKLKAARKASGKTQAQVAKESGIAEVAYQMYEYGKREPRVRTAIRIAQTLDATVEELFGDGKQCGLTFVQAHQTVPRGNQGTR